MNKLYVVDDILFPCLRKDVRVWKLICKRHRLFLESDILLLYVNFWCRGTQEWCFHLPRCPP